MTLPAANRHRVIGRHDLSADIFELILSREGVTFTPGENLTLFNGQGTVSRPYSIASGIDEDVLRFVIRRMPAGRVSHFLGGLHAGDVVTATPPFGWFRPGQDGNGSPYAFLATGTGIAPFLSWLRSNPEHPPMWLLYGIRHRCDAIALDELIVGTDLHLAVSREQAAGFHHGRITDLLPQLPIPPNTTIYLCGLDAMIDHATEILEARGVPFGQIHREVFFHAVW